MRYVSLCISDAPALSARASYMQDENKDRMPQMEERSI